MTTPPVPRPEPVEVAPETFLIPHGVPAQPGTVLPVNSLVIRADEPVVVDTGAPVHLATWREMVFSLVDPEDVRWVFLSHDDGDHRGGLRTVLEECPNATLVTNWFTVERVALEEELPLDRMIWREALDSFDAGDRTLHLVLPPVFDGPTTRGLLDPTTGVLWAVDSFAALGDGSGPWVEDVPVELYDQTFRDLASFVSPWHQWLDPDRYARHVRQVRAFGARVVASAHGPVHTRPETIEDAFARTIELAGAEPSTTPRQAVLDEILAAATASSATVTAA
jgi:flavorubredoxin